MVSYDKSQIGKRAIYHLALCAKHPRVKYDYLEPTRSKNGLLDLLGSTIESKTGHKHEIDVENRNTRDTRLGGKSGDHLSNLVSLK